MTASRPLPDSPAGFRDATLADVVPYFEELLERPLDDIPAWLAAWSRLEALFTDAQAEAEIAYDCDTTSEERERAALRFSSEIAPQLESWRVALAQRLVRSGYTRPDLETTIRRWRNRIELFREENVELFAELEKLGSRYSKVTGGMTVEWDGERLTPSQVRPFAASGDRAVRERAFRAFFSPYVDARDELAGIFDEMYGLRQRIARNAGFDNFRDFTHRQKNRFDYTPADCERFHDAVEATVVPAVERIYARRARQMGLDGPRVRPWDAIDGHLASPDPLGRPPLRPFESQDDLVAAARDVFRRVDPDLGGYFALLVEGGMLDLMSRPGKAPGGYCATLPFRGLPFIFMNSSGIANDVDTLLHESGHAFHSLEAMGSLPLVFQRFAGSEMAEVASMSMELLAAPYLRESFYSDADARRARSAHLEELLTGVAHIASVDAFQHWIYTSGEGGDRDARDRRWVGLRERFQHGVDWTGCERERIARWYEQIHFFNYPLYYIEYGIAQMGALQVWRNALTDQPGAVAAYRRALALGGSRPLPELFAEAGARLVFDTDGMAPLIELVEEELDRLSTN